MTDSPTGALSERDQLRSALGAMLTQFGMDEDQWNCATFNQARAALASRSTEPGGEAAVCQYSKEVDMPEYRCAVKCQYAESIEMEARLSRAAGVVAAQAGQSHQEFVEWLCNGGFVQMALSHFGVSTPPPISASKEAAQCVNCLGTLAPSTLDPEWKGRCECTGRASKEAAPTDDEIEGPYSRQYEGMDGIDYDKKPEPSSAVKAVAESNAFYAAWDKWSPKGDASFDDFSAGYHAAKSEPRAPVLTADPLQGAADWLKKAIGDCTAADIASRLFIGHNRASRLFAASTTQPPATKGME